MCDSVTRWLPWHSKRPTQDQGREGFGSGGGGRSGLLLPGGQGLMSLRGQDSGRDKRHWQLVCVSTFLLWV